MLDSSGFSLPTRIAFGDGVLEQTAQLIQETCSGKRIFVVTDPGIMRAGIAEPVITSLTQNGYTVEVFDRVSPNPKDVDCEAGGDQIRAYLADIVLAIGGGSVIDSAKAIALLHTHHGRLKEYEGKNKEATRMLVHALYEMADEIGIPSFRSLAYVRREDFPALAKASFINGSTPSNCREITTEDYLRLFEEAYAIK